MLSPNHADPIDGYIPGTNPAPVQRIVTPGIQFDMAAWERASERFRQQLRSMSVIMPALTWTSNTTTTNGFAIR